jgi:hypothetical protein
MCKLLDTCCRPPWHVRSLRENARVFFLHQQFPHAFHATPGPSRGRARTFASCLASYSHNTRSKRRHVLETHGMAAATFLLPTCHRCMHRAPPPPTTQLPPSSAPTAPTQLLDEPDGTSCSPCRDRVSHSLTWKQKCVFKPCINVFCTYAHIHVSSHTYAHT